MTTLLILNIFSTEALPDKCYGVVVVRENLALCETFMKKFLLEKQVTAFNYFCK